MKSNLDKYKADLEKLLGNGQLLIIAMHCECFPDQLHTFPGIDRKIPAKEVKDLIPSFNKTYQSWYSEAKVLVKQLLPDRLADLARHYEKPKPRKEITFDNYRIEDYLQGLTVTKGSDIFKEKIVGLEAAIPHLEQQVAILRAVKMRFESSLFEIKSLVQADIFDSEIESAKELAKNGYLRAAGAICGVVLETHLVEIVTKHEVKLKKKSPCISDYNNALKERGIIDTPQWRFIQHLGDIRNLCDHKKTADPTSEQIQDLISGVSKITKTIF